MSETTNEMHLLNSSNDTDNNTNNIRRDDDDNDDDESIADIPHVVSLEEHNTEASTYNNNNNTSGDDNGGVLSSTTALTNNTNNGNNNNNDPARGGQCEITAASQQQSTTTTSTEKDGGLLLQNNNNKLSTLNEERDAQLLLLEPSQQKLHDVNSMEKKSSNIFGSSSNKEEEEEEEKVGSCSSSIGGGKRKRSPVLLDGEQQPQLTNKEAVVEEESHYSNHFHLEKKLKKVNSNNNNNDESSSKQMSQHVNEGASILSAMKKSSSKSSSISSIVVGEEEKQQDPVVGNIKKQKLSFESGTTAAAATMGGGSGIIPQSRHQHQQQQLPIVQYDGDLPIVLPVPTLSNGGLSPQWDGGGGLVDATHSSSVGHHAKQHQSYNVPAAALPPLEMVASSSSAIMHHHVPPNKSSIVSLSDQQQIMKELSMRSKIRTIDNHHHHPSNPHHDDLLTLLLAMPDDDNCLNEQLCLVRDNIEVFTSTESDVNAPSPGRKKTIHVGQVGLRCIHCSSHGSTSSSTSSSSSSNKERKAKRAVSYPTNIQRIYRSVLDMKLDHFKLCPHVPLELKTQLYELQHQDGGSDGSKKKQKRNSSGITVQYFEHSARSLGMMDMEGGGVCIDLNRVGLVEDVPMMRLEKKKQQPPAQHHTKVSVMVASQAAPSSGGSNGIEIFDEPSHRAPPPRRYSGKVLLALDDDNNFLSPLRCFLRENVCIFTTDLSTKNIAAVTNTGQIAEGKVGLGCIHCLEAGQKSNRAVCFPNTMARVYQGVADMQRFHFGACKTMPPESRAKYLKLLSGSVKGSAGPSSKKYWIDGLKKLGLADGGCDGMYFFRDPSLPPPPSDHLNVLAQAACRNESLVEKKLVTDDDKPTIAGFVYLAMQQMRSCAFTDADRNKRRDAANQIGVECIHCAASPFNGRKFFWSSLAAVESNFVSVHSHLISCSYVPEETKKELVRLKAVRKDETSCLAPGSQKAFFARVWARLHGQPVPAIPSPTRTKKKKKKKALKQVHIPNDMEKNSKAGDRKKAATNSKAGRQRKLPKKLSDYNLGTAAEDELEESQSMARLNQTHHGVNDKMDSAKEETNVSEGASILSAMKSSPPHDKSQPFIQEI